VPSYPAGPTIIRVAVVAEDPLARAGLVALFVGHEALGLVGHGSPADAGRLSADADVLLWDAGAGAGALGTGFDELATAVLTLVGDDRQAVLALALGARGVLPRDVGASRLAAAIAAANEGLLVVDEAFRDTLGRRDAALEPPAEPLTRRELEVLTLLGQGLSNKAIASRLGISESTAKFHVNAILGKLGVTSRSEAIVHASRLGLVIL
jgi:two-component system nitrate/nitrite response regulator NarL